jgi:hypothetical protein
MKAYIIAIALTTILFQGQAQKSPIKFGEIPIENMKMNSYKEDSSASAIVLVDYGVAYITFNTSSASLIFDRHVRIKILRKDGLKWADAKIMTYHSGSSEEKVSNLKAATYNLEGGSILETKMSKDAVFKEKFNNDFNVQKFTLPNVKEGSVIEYSYRINSDFLQNFPDWEFQKEIPIVLSEYWAVIPEFFIFEKYLQGYVPLTNFEVKPKTNPDFSENANHYVMKNVPAFKAEPYMTCEDDYLSKINFALSHISWPGRPVQEIMGSWEKLNSELLNDENFGKIISRSGFLKDLVAELTAGISDPMKKVESIHTYIKQNIEWDGTKDKYADNLKKVIENKKGTAADINLMLASMLDKAGFKVNMVLLSTRDHGIVRPSYPMEKQFNYVICELELEDKTILLDATEKYLPLTALPERCLNGQGLVISPIHYRWVDVNTKTKAKTMINTELSLLKTGELKGNLLFIRSGYDALQMRKTYNTKGEADYVKDFLGSKTWQVEKTEFESVKEIEKPVKESHQLLIDDHTSVAGDIIYINPFIIGQLKENPFKLADRLYPVDFGSPIEQMHLGKIVIPEGYTVEELPQSKVMVLPNNAAKYAYSATQVGNIISFASNMQINKSLFTQDEYVNLREFYNQVIAKQAEQIVLKKK